MQLYNTDISKLGVLLTPPRLRSISVVAFIKALLTPLVVLKGEFATYRDDKNYWMKVTPQVCWLEKALNDNFDNVERRIYIKNSKGLDVILLQPDEVNKPVTIGTNTAVIINPDSSYANAGYDFIVYIPQDIDLREWQLYQAKAILNNNILADKTYDIVRI